MSLTEGRLIERFGWTLNELDTQDSGRTLQIVSMLNLAQLYPEVLRAVEKHSTDTLTPAHWAAFKIMDRLGEDDIS